jgi:putative transcriptional regulator
MNTPDADSIRLNSSSSPQARHVAQGWLEGQLLVATPQVKGDMFAQSVIYLFVHNEEGAMGLVLNKPLDQIQTSEVLDQLGIEAGPQMRPLPVLHGGPVEEQRGFLLHSGDYASDTSLRAENGLSVTASAAILKAIAQGRGPHHRLLLLGYAGWGAGQLEAEMEQNSWISVPATPELVFHEEPDELWSLAAGSLGIDMGRFSPTAGHA